ncbi:hypothetical protein BJX70DRAFT_368685 [Aspergillus crustosus]
MYTLVSFLLLYILPLAATAATAADTCNYDKPTNCINVQAKGTHSFSFDPYFTENATFVYAIDSITDEVQKTAFWLEYPVLYTNNDARNISQVGMLFTNASGSPGGGNNGCNNLLSEQCTKNLKDALKWGVLANLQDQQNQSLSNALRGLAENPLRNLSCPTDLFDDSALTATWNSSSDVTRPFTLEVPRTFEYDYIYDGYSGNLPSGSASQTYSFPVDRERSHEAQLGKVGVGIIVRAPIYIEPVYSWELKDYTGGRNVTFDEIQLELVCVKTGGDGDSNSNDDGNDKENQDASSADEDPDENSAGRASAFILPVAIGGLVAFTFLSK